MGLSVTDGTSTLAPPPPSRRTATSGSFRPLLQTASETGPSLRDDSRADIYGVVCGFEDVLDFLSSRQGRAEDSAGRAAPDGRLSVVPTVALVADALRDDLTPFFEAPIRDAAGAGEIAKRVRLQTEEQAGSTILRNVGPLQVLISAVLER